MSAPSSPKRKPLLDQGLFPLGLVLMASALAWTVLFAAIPPAAQEFPLVDDWAYARGAFLFAQGKGIHYGGWGSMPQLGQWLWTAPFLWLLGLSFFALRLSTVLLSWLGLWAFFDLLRGQGWTSRAAALATAALAFNPIFFLLQGTFLTDVPALSFSLIALTLYVRGLRGSSGLYLSGACAVSLLGAITRQNTLAVPAAAALLLWRNPEQRRRPLGWLAVGLPIVAGLAAHFWFQQRTDVLEVGLRVQPPSSLVLLPFVLLQYCGLAVLPLLLLNPWGGRRKVILATLVFMALSAVYWFFHPRYFNYGPLFPYCDGILTPWGAYTPLLMAGDRPPLMGASLRLLLTVLSGLSGAVFLGHAWDQLPPRRRAEPLLLLALFQVPFILVAPELWDRYFLVILPGALSLVPPARDLVSARWIRAAACVVLAALASIGLMHDWLAWNAARWELGLRALRQRGLSPSQIEGGFEWNGRFAPPLRERRPWRDLALSPEKAKRMKPKGLTLLSTQLWFPSVTGEYALSFSRLPHTRVLDQQPYSQWLLSGKHAFYLLTLDMPRRPQNNTSQPPRRIPSASGGRKPPDSAP